MLQSTSLFASYYRSVLALVDYPREMVWHWILSRRSLWILTPNAWPLTGEDARGRR